MPIPISSWQSRSWCKRFDDFCEQFYAETPPGIWFVFSAEIELLATTRSEDCGNIDSEAQAEATPQIHVGVRVS
jgi:hypothetical protein